MKYVLDTNAVSALMRGEQAMIARLLAVEPAEVGVSHPTWAEIHYGIERLPASKKKTALREKLELLRSEIPTVPWSERVSESFGEIKATLEKQGKRLEDFDVAIAAHALASGSVLVSANTQHMLRVPALLVEDWSKL